MRSWNVFVAIQTLSRHNMAILMTVKAFWQWYQNLDWIRQKKLQHGQMTIKLPEVPATFQSNQTKNNWLMRQAQRLHVTKMLYPIIVFDFLCKLCPEREEAINHVTAESKMFTQQYCLWQHDGAVAVVHLMMCKRYGFPTGTK